MLGFDTDPGALFINWALGRKRVYGHSGQVGHDGPVQVGALSTGVDAVSPAFPLVLNPPGPILWPVRMQRGQPT
jgi:hypothetical protein